MTSKNPSDPFRDIVASIEKSKRFVAGIDLVAFTEDVKTISALERELEKIGEAAVRLGKKIEQLCPGPPWADIRGKGNCLRHQSSHLPTIARRAKRIGTNAWWDTSSTGLRLWGARIGAQSGPLDRKSVV